MKNLPVIALRSNGGDYLRKYHHLRVGNDVALDDLLRPGFWCHHTDKLNKDDMIDVVSDVLDVQMRVIDKGVGFVKMRPLRIWAKNEPAEEKTPEASAIPPLPEGYEIKRGPGGRFRVFQKEPLLEISTKTFVTEYDAVMAARVHFETVNAVAA